MCARPKKWRTCSPRLKDYFYKPRGVEKPEIANLNGDELEAMRLCDLDDLEHEDAAEKVGISRRTLERILRSGRFKVVSALTSGSAIKISFPEYILFREKTQKERR